MKKYLKNLPEGNALSGIILIACTAISLLMANYFIGQPYINFWHLKIGNNSLLHIINDMLMTIFFLVVGLEIKKELLIGELDNKKKAFLPFVCAIGGMLFPALIFQYFNYNTINSNGWGIPTATDIAFSIGILAILGSRIPIGLKVFLTALAIIDDLGAVVVIALFYSQEISFLYLIVALVLTLLLYLTTKYLKIYSAILTILIGCIVWYFLNKSGIHGTITGVLLAMTIPLEYKRIKPLEVIVNFLHKPVNYFIIPVFAIANTALIISSDISNSLISNISLGIIFGLFIGKPLGIMVTAFLAIKLKLAEMPKKVNWKLLLGVSMLAGIGFTMSLFVSFIAYEDAPRQDISKIAILIGSLISGVFGLTYLKIVIKR